MQLRGKLRNFCDNCTLLKSHINRKNFYVLKLRYFHILLICCLVWVTCVMKVGITVVTTIPNNKNLEVTSVQINNNNYLKRNLPGTVTQHDDTSATREEEK